MLKTSEVNGKKYHRDVNGRWTEVKSHLNTTESANGYSVIADITIEDRRPPVRSVSGRQIGNWGNENGNYVDSAEYRARHCSNGEALKEKLDNWSARHASRPLPPTRLPEEIIADQIAAGDIPDPFLNHAITPTPTEQVNQKMLDAMEHTHKIETAAQSAEMETTNGSPIGNPTKI